MFEKIKRAMKKGKMKLIVVLILWLFISIVLIVPFSIAIKDAEVDGEFHIVKCFEYLSQNLQNLFGSFGTLFTGDYFSYYLGVQAKFTLIYIIAMIIGLRKVWPKNEYDTIEHGSSDWCENGEQYKILSSKKGILLAEKNYLPLDKMGNINVLVVGGSGSGKSASFVIPNAYQCLGSYVFTDPKGELFDKTSGYLKSNGYDIKVLNLVNPSCSDGYNPLFHIKSELDVDVIANTIVKGQKTDGGGKEDPFWDDMAEALLKALIYYLKATRPLEEQNLASCAELVRISNTGDGANRLSALMNELPSNHPARRYYKNIEIAPEKTYSSILSSLQSKLGKFDSKDIAELTSTNTINFEEISSKKTAVYVISSDTHTAYDFLLTLFFSQMIQQMYDFADKSGGKLPVPTYFILDEFANIGKIPDFDKKISTSRSRKISFSVILQNLDQLEAVYGKNYETIMGNCDTHLFLGSNSQKTVEYFSKALGEKTISRDSISVNRDKASVRTGYSTSDQIMGRALLTPDELRRFDNNKCIIFEKGIKPIKADKYYYFKYSTVKYEAQYPANHNELENIERGKWRIFDPDRTDDYEENTPDVQIEALDDLFEEPAVENENNDNVQPDIQVLPETENSDIAPTLPVEETDTNTTEDTLSPDLEKELEAKFDELFGEVESSDNKKDE